MTLAAGMMSIPQQAAQVILIYLLQMSFTVVVGLQSPCTTFLGNHIGKGNIVQANMYFRVSLFFLFLVILTQITIYYLFEFQIFAFFTQE